MTGWRACAHVALSSLTTNQHTRSHHVSFLGQSYNTPPFIVPPTPSTQRVAPEQQTQLQAQAHICLIHLLATTKQQNARMVVKV